MGFLLGLWGFRVIEAIEGLKLCGCIKGLLSRFGLFGTDGLHFLCLILFDEGESELFSVLIDGIDGLVDVVVLISF